MFVVKKYGTGDQGDFCDVELFETRDAAERRLHADFLRRINDELVHELDSDVIVLLRQRHEMKQDIDMVDDGGDVSVGYTPGESYGSRSDDTGVRVHVEIEKIDFNPSFG